MSEAQQRALARAFELKTEGNTWAEVKEALEREGFKDSTGKPYTDGNLRARYSKLKGKAPGTEVPPMPAFIDTVDKVDAETPERKTGHPNPGRSDCHVGGYGGAVKRID